MNCHRYALKQLLNYYFYLILFLFNIIIFTMISYQVMMIVSVSPLG